MTIERKVAMGIAGQPSGDAANVAEVFSTDLFNIGNANLRIRNGIDLSGEGGMVWFASRAEQKSPNITDTERGAGYRLRPFSNYNANGSVATTEVVTQFRPDGFNYGDGYNSSTAVTWTFRKKEKFFDVVTYTGNGVAGREISHGLAGPVGMIIVKKVNGSGNWHVLHRSVPLSGSPAEGALRLNTTGSANSYSSNFNETFPTDSVFYVSHVAGASSATLNTTNETYVAYLFADNSSEDAEDQMIKCGSYTGNGNSNGPEINLGWEPQFWLMKRSDSTSPWRILDSLRGWAVGGSDFNLSPNTTAAESNEGSRVSPTSTGFKLNASFGDWNASGATYIYMAIRAPMMVEPEAATDVFAMYSGGTSQSYPQYLSGFPVDMALHRATTSTNSELATRLLGAGLLKTNATDAWGASGAYAFDYSNGWFTHGSPTYFTNYKSWMWKRAKGFMDVVAYTGSSSAGNLTINHSLGVAPELIISKSRSNAQAWSVLFNMGASSYQYFTTLGTAPDYGSGRSYGSGYLASKPTDTAYAIKTDTGIGSGNNYIAYLFATLAGISKVGSYTGNGSNQTINCGFSAGSRFILIKRVNNSGDWYFWDSVRGIVAGNDPHLSLNTSAAQVTSDDSVDPHNSGFIVNQVSATNINVSSEEYLFYAIA